MKYTHLIALTAIGALLVATAAGFAQPGPMGPIGPMGPQMRIAQQLYEGIDISEEGQTGLITYMRTDSFRIADEAKVEARKYISSKFGDKYLPTGIKKYKTRKLAQEAHEAIRPTSVFRTPQKIKKNLTSEQNKLYNLIWSRFVASQMADAEYRTTTVEISQSIQNRFGK